MSHSFEYLGATIRVEVDPIFGGAVFDVMPPDEESEQLDFAFGNTVWCGGDDLDKAARDAMRWVRQTWILALCIKYPTLRPVES